MKSGMMMACCIGLLLLLTIVPAVTHAAVPQQINYQGSLKDSDGDPVPDGDYEMSFAIYDVPTGGTSLWGESQTVPVTNGIYDVILGQPGNLLDPDDFDGDLYLGVTVDPDAEMTPRQKLTSTAFSMKAAKTDSVVDGGITDVMIADDAISESKIASGAVTSDKIADGATIAEILDNDGAGSNLDSDLLDGLDSGAFASSAHSHDSTYVNRDGDTMSGSSTSGLLSATNAGTGPGVRGANADGAFGYLGGSNYGVYGRSSAPPEYTGPAGGLGGSYGVYGQFGGISTTTGPYGYIGGYDRGVYGSDNGSGTNFAGYFDGNVKVIGVLSASRTGSSGVIQLVSSSNVKWNLYSGFTGLGEFSINEDAASGNPARLFIETGGNVGIGTTDPDARLEVAGNLKVSGNVGIGTATPTKKLHVSSPSSSWGMVTFENSNTGKNEVSISFAEGSDVVSNDIWLAGVGIWGNSGDFMIGRPGASSKFMIDNNGDVGIGTTDPDARLEVAGNLKVSGTGNGIEFPDGTVQTTAPAPIWHQKLPAAERFELVMNGEAVLDKETGLVWEQSPDTTQKSWYVARSNCYSREVANRKGWRLPSVEELASLVDNDNSNPTLPTGHPFSNVQLDKYYWSSTTEDYITHNAWAVEFSDSDVFFDLKGLDGHYWCVRGGLGHNAVITGFNP